MFYDNLKSLCDSKGLKVTNVVTECGGALGSITGWKRGVMPNSNIVIALATYLNVSTDYLLLGKKESTTSSISNSIVDHSFGTITVGNTKDAKPEVKTQSEQVISDITKEIIEISESLSMKEQVRLLNLIYDFEEQCKKADT